jgi:hypothetical protein
MPNNVSPIDRRTILAGAAAAAGLAAFPSALSAARVMLQLATGSVQDWTSAIGTSFTALTEIGAMTIRLVAVEAQPVDPGRPTNLARGAGFIAVFAIPAGLSPAGDRTYRLSAPNVRTMDIYFSAAAGDLRAVFN